MIKFYSVQLRESIEVPTSDVTVVTMKNGKLAAKAMVKKDGKDISLFKILSKDDAARLGK